MYPELHSSSAFSFLRGSSSPEDLVAQAARLGYGAVGLADRDGLAGAPRFFQAAKKAGVRPIVGAEVTLPGEGLVTLFVESREGYRNLSRLLTSRARAVGSSTNAQRNGLGLGFDEPELLEGLVALSSNVSTIDALATLFGKERTFVEVQRHLTRESHRQALGLLDLADARGLQAIATNGVLHAKPQGRRLVDVFTCLRNHTTLSRAGRLLSQNAERHLKRPADMQALFADRPDVLRNTLGLSDRLRFTLSDLGYRFPDYPLPSGETNDSFLRAITVAGAHNRYRPYHDKARAQIEKELGVIAKLGLAGYFLIVWDLMQFCKTEGILAQGRGSAANSAVCYSLGITAVDPVGMELLFERFLSEERGEWPDIDIDLPSGDRREKVIQHVYTKYGPHGAAMTANVITYREKSASREIGKVLELPDDVVENVSRQMRRFEWHDTKDTFDARLERAGVDRSDLRLKVFARLFHDIQDLPRHLGQHSGGMIVAQGRLDEVVPLQPASMPGRTIVQWDKEDCADLGIIKVDLLGLGMMASLSDTISILSSTGVEIDIAHLPENDPKTYAQIRAADTVGVFQIESRAQMSMLPRLKPNCFYDLVVEVAIVRPGPISGGMVHPYLKARSRVAQGLPIEYERSSLEQPGEPARLQLALQRTLGIPIFQEQVMQISMVAAGFTATQADSLRRAMAAWKRKGGLGAFHNKFIKGMLANGYQQNFAERIFEQIKGFGEYGFPESHAYSFALLAYQSSWLKCNHPDCYLAAMLNSQPMGFYGPSQLIQDAQRHGVQVLPADVSHSDWNCTLQEGVVRLGLRLVGSLAEASAHRIVAARGQGAGVGFVDVQGLALRAQLDVKDVNALASADALQSLAGHRRQQVWEAASRHRAPALLQAAPVLEDLLTLPAAPQGEEILFDYRAMGLSLRAHPLALLRARLARSKLQSAAQLNQLVHGASAAACGLVTVRQQPQTAKGTLFVTLEDETGNVNVIVWKHVREAQREPLLRARLLAVRGIWQRDEDSGGQVCHLVARRLTDLTPLLGRLGELPSRSRDFH